VRASAIFVDCVYVKSHRAGPDFVDNLFGYPAAFRPEVVVHGAERSESGEGRALPNQSTSTNVQAWSDGSPSPQYPR
jgi:hypothetical protein